ncbi:uncharacterized protein LOC114917130 isoform X2 [Cajanus cajan]|nr:uncharacterized protein LOC114917130 isoform X2 [Cajanus cajan]
MTLDDANFSTWKKEALEAIKANKLDKIIITEVTDGGRPRKFKTPEDEVLGKISEEYENWERQDQVVYKWLLASISTKLRVRMVGCDHAFQIWKKIEAFIEKKECQEICKTILTLKSKSMFTQKLKKLAEEFLELSNEMLP